MRRQQRPLPARAEDPERRRGGAGRHRAHPGEGMAGRQLVMEKADEIGELLGELLQPQRPRPLSQRPRGALVAAGRAADAEVDAAGEQRLQHAEVLGHLEGAVVAEHDAARAHADARGPRRDLADEDLGSGAGQPAATVMLGQPVPVIAETIGALGELQRLLDGLGRGPAAPDGRLVEHPEDHVAFSLHPPPSSGPARKRGRPTATHTQRRTSRVEVRRTHVQPVSLQIR